jgi:hypothetical protein
VGVGEEGLEFVVELYVEYFFSGFPIKGILTYVSLKHKSR